MPHTGRLVAEIDGWRCTFNVDIWQTPSAELTELLNRRTDSAVKHHWDIQSLAEGVLDDVGLKGRWQNVECEGDAWRTGLPPGAVD